MLKYGSESESYMTENITTLRNWLTTLGCLDDEAKNSQNFHSSIEHVIEKATKGDLQAWEVAGVVGYLKSAIDAGELDAIDQGGNYRELRGFLRGMGAGKRE